MAKEGPHFFLLESSYLEDLVDDGKEERKKMSAHAANMGQCSRVRACMTLLSAPIEVSENFLIHVSADSPLNISPNYMVLA